MYIVKISENKEKGYYKGLPNLIDGYHEMETLEEAMKLRESWIKEYPFLVKVEIFCAKQIVIDDSIQELARFCKKAYWEKVAHYKSLGFDRYTELDKDGNVLFEF